MILEQYYLACLAHASYLIVDEKTKTAAVVDPRRDIEIYLREAGRHGATITHVLLTHFHADFLAGHLELRELTGARIALGARAQAEYDFTPLADGDTIELGDVRLQALETPGHTPEGISILVFDLTTSADTPHAVLTGDTLFIGDVGRPDLMASIGVTPEELGGMLYDSTREKLLTLPDETLVYPAHGAGSMCGKNLSTDTVSTIGAQRATNYALQPMTRDEFIAMATADLPEQPAYFAYDARLNKEERPLYDPSHAHVAALKVDELMRMQNSGAQLLDVRTSEVFAAGHLAGAVNIGLDGKFATWAGALLEAERPIVLVAEPKKEAEAAMRLARIGFDRVAGFLEDGMGASSGTPDLVLRSERLDPDELRAELASPTPPLVLDVRTPTEWNDGHIADAMHLPLTLLGRRLDEVPRDRRVIVACKAGYRSSAAASMLARAGHPNVADLRGGMDAYEGTAATCSTS